MISLYESWEGCDKCTLCKERTNIVFGEGSVDAEIVIVGESPGENEDIEGKPFIGDSGAILREFLTAVGIEKNNFFLTNTVKCRPPEDRDPTAKERKACAPLLNREIYILDPLLIIAAGKVAFTHLARGQARSMKDGHGMLFPCTIPGERFMLTYDVMPMWHPAYTLRYDDRYKSGPKKGQWKEGGSAEDTFHDLSRAMAWLKDLQAKYRFIAEQHRNS
jgi:DNA polymerase